MSEAKILPLTSYKLRYNACIAPMNMAKVLGLNLQTGHSKLRISGLAVKLVIQIRSTMETYALQN
jgi:hypothetical protein